MSVVVSLVLALANGLRIYLMYRNLQMALVVSISLVGTVIAAKVIGSMLPIFAKQCHVDPAIMTSPLITTIVDTFSIIVYFNVETVIFRL